VRGKRMPSTQRDEQVRKTMNTDLKHADSRALHESSLPRLSEIGPNATFTRNTSLSV